MCMRVPALRLCHYCVLHGHRVMCVACLVLSFRAKAGQPWVTYESSSVITFSSTNAPASPEAALNPANYRIDGPGKFNAKGSSSCQTTALQLPSASSVFPSALMPLALLSNKINPSVGGEWLAVLQALLPFKDGTNLRGWDVLQAILYALGKDLALPRLLRSCRCSLYTWQQGGCAAFALRNFICFLCACLLCRWCLGPDCGCKLPLPPPVPGSSGEQHISQPHSMGLPCVLEAGITSFTRPGLQHHCTGSCIWTGHHTAVVRGRGGKHQREHTRQSGRRFGFWRIMIII